MHHPLYRPPCYSASKFPNDFLTLMQALNTSSLLEFEMPRNKKSKNLFQNEKTNLVKNALY